MMKIFTVFIIYFFCASSSFGAGDEAEKKIMGDYCSRPAVEVDISSSLYEAGSDSSILIQLLSGNTTKVIEQLGAELAIKVILLNTQLQNNPCRASKETLDRIYPIFRVIAAVNHKAPIPKLNENKEAVEILRQAIADNPKHYQQLLERSADWGHGIK
jgi:hypothetical protein